MNARVMRKWSLHKYLMPYLWLVVVTILLLIVCTPQAVTSMHLQITPETAKTAAVPISSLSTPSTPSTVGMQRFRNRRKCRDARSNVVDTTITTAFISIEDEDAGNSNSNSNNHKAEDSIRSIRNRNSKVFRNSNLIRNIRQNHQQIAPTDSIIYPPAYYYNAPTVFDVSFNREQQQQQSQHQQQKLHQPNDKDDDYFSSVTGASAIYNSNEKRRNNFRIIPNSNSQMIINNKNNNDNNHKLFNSFENNHNNNNNDKYRLQQQQQNNNNYNYPNSLNNLTSKTNAYNNNNSNNLNIKSKTRRHIQSKFTQHLLTAQRTISSSSSSSATPFKSSGTTHPLQNYHSPVREVYNSNGNSSSVIVHRTTPAPFRYILETFEIPDTLSFTGEFTQQQRRLLIRQDEMRRLRFLQAAAAAADAAARSRRDSRGDSLDTIGGGENNNNYDYHHHQQQQQQQQQIQQHQHHHQQSQQRKRTRRYCSARDPAQLAFEAPTVFEGKIISMTPDRRANFSATVEVKEIFKQQIGYRLQNYLRLQFSYRNTSGECDIYRETLRPRGLVRGDELEQGRVYLMFVQQIDLRNFTILGQPIRKTRRVIEAVKNAVSENYAQLASIRSITASNRTVENGKELRIICKVQGRPPPKVTWFKDHKSINRNRRLYQFVHYKKRSELIIRSFNSSDAGRYECRAKNKVNRNLERRAILIKAYPIPRYDMPTPQSGGKCPEDAYEFCLNGGTCKFFTEIGSYSCICPEGYMGERCDLKEVNNMPPSPTYKTGYIADDPNVLGINHGTGQMISETDSVIEDDEDVDQAESEEQG